MIVLIPAYEPDQRLVDLVAAIRSARPSQRVVIVDDGSRDRYAHVFEEARSIGCEVVAHERNRGKGAALKSGFAHIRNNGDGGGSDVVCADCDGQHTLEDIERVGVALADHRDGMVLGARQFAGEIPLRSRIGNDATRLLLRWLTGLRLRDTQTGLRAYPRELLDWLLVIPGDRFEYELEVLLAAKRDGLSIHEVPIETIYLDGNESSHFQPVRDSIRVYRPLWRYALHRGRSKSTPDTTHSTPLS